MGGVGGEEEVAASAGLDLEPEDLGAREVADDPNASGFECCSKLRRRLR